MAIEMRTELPEMTAEQMDLLATHVLPQMKTFPGFLAHASGPMDSGGYYVTEVWESRDAHETWVREVIAPIMQRAGGGQPPTPTYRRVTTVIV